MSTPTTATAVVVPITQRTVSYPSASRVSGDRMPADLTSAGRVLGQAPTADALTSATTAIDSPHGGATDAGTPDAGTTDLALVARCRAVMTQMLLRLVVEPFDSIAMEAAYTTQQLLAEDFNAAMSRLDTHAGMAS